MSFVPVNLYRVQLHHAFTFYDAIAILPYLKELGIDTLYCSPFFQAVYGSMHGYDVSNPLVLNHELGGEKGFNVFEQKARLLGFGIILDLVVNHMAASVQNSWWYDILENGKESIYATYFDIDWSSPVANLVNKVLVPILDLPSKEALIQGKIQLELNKKGLFIAAMGQLFPLSPTSYNRVSAEIKNKKELKILLNNQKLYKQIQEQVEQINQDKEHLQRLLDEQHFFLEFWQYAPQNINYRRFFDINGLAALNMDNQACFDDVHRLASRLFIEGKVQGMRVDHPDGIYDLERYFTALRKKCAGTYEPYIILEKILEREESIPESWAVEGSVGYEYLNLLNQLFLRESEKESFTHIYEMFIGKSVDGELMSQQEKRQYTLLYMASEVNTMSFRLFRESRPNACTQEELKEAIVELYAAFPVYRTYIQPDTLVLNAAEKLVFLQAFDVAMSSKPHLEKSFEFLGEIFFHRRELSESEIAFIIRFQQIAPAIMAKGVEDTHLYNYNRFISLNEVGGSPHHFGESIEWFHEQMQVKVKRFPYGWITSSTHDTKRSHDIRLRLNVLSELSLQWKEQVLRWKKDNAKYKKGGFPDLNREYFLYQTLVGFWPTSIPGIEEKKFLIERIKNYLIKASRESKEYTNWIHHHIAYEHALLSFIDEILDERHTFYQSLNQWVKKIDFSGQLNSLSCLNLTFMLPAPLDIYQGTELWDFSLVDPDNRRTVDYQKREKLLEEVNQVLHNQNVRRWILDVLEKRHLEILKLYMMKVGLKLRKEYNELVFDGSYIPIRCGGTKKDHVIAYLRKDDQGRYALTLSGRYLLEYKGKEFWKDTYIELPQQWKEGVCFEVYTGAKIHIKRSPLIQELLTILPFGLFLCYPPTKEEESL